MSMSTRSFHQTQSPKQAYRGGAWTFDSRIIGRAIGYTVFGVYTVLTIYPLFWLFTSAFKSNQEIIASAIALPTELHIENFRVAWRLANLGRLFANSVVYTSATLAIVLTFSLMAAYAFSKMRFRRLSAVFLALIGGGLLISTHSILIPLFIFLRQVGLTGEASRLGVILSYSAIHMPMALLLVTVYVRRIPNTLIESAYMDGASRFRTLRSIVGPMSTPVLTTAGIVTGLATWNEFLLGFILTTGRTRPLPPGVFAFANPMTPSYDLQFAALAIATVPVLVVYAIFNRRIASGVAAMSQAKM